MKELRVVGSNTLIKVAGIPGVPAKVDTGADSSAIWATAIALSPDGVLEFVLFGPESPFYTGEKLTTKHFRVQQVRNSMGGVDIRYRAQLPIVIRGKRIRANFTLSDRSKNGFPVLIGRKTLKNRFLVDVSRIGTKRPEKKATPLLNAEFQVDPQKFHQKYMEHKNQ